MARPRKCRRICHLPPAREFRPEGEAEGEVTLTLDEVECLRLLDVEGLTQEQCAAQMEVARATAALICAAARAKVADALVHGRIIRIQGGEVALCRRMGRCCGRCGGEDCPRCRNRVCGQRPFPPEGKGSKDMKIAVTYEDGQVFQHFGHTSQFKLYTVEDGRVTESRVVDTAGEGHGALAEFLVRHGADTLICGGIGGGARNALAQAGIRLYGGVSGSADGAVEALLTGNLNYNPDEACTQHQGEANHQCAHHHGEGHEGCHSGSCT